ncbi:MAG: hypothetical protein PHJ00_01980 [Candidatus Omnitrophica bacterium]|nr:hypothetical protein [Candidatus Omnitrophota bacterium]MDD5654679.1 hypothetical protein [Candidatus Omnitrophota bacterium]
MRILLFRGNKGVAGVIELLLGVLIMGGLVYIALNIYFKQGIISGPSSGTVSSTGADVSNRKTAIDNAKQNVEELNKRINEQNKQLEILEH